MNVAGSKSAANGLKYNLSSKIQVIERHGAKDRSRKATSKPHQSNDERDHHHVDNLCDDASQNCWLIVACKIHELEGKENQRSQLTLPFFVGVRGQMPTPQ